VKSICQSDWATHHDQGGIHPNESGKKYVFFRSKAKGEMRLDDNETRISGARRADVTGVGAWEPSCRGLGIAKTLKKRQLHTCHGCHPVDVG